MCINKNYCSENAITTLVQLISVISLARCEVMFRCQVCHSAFLQNAGAVGGTFVDLSENKNHILSKLDKPAFLYLNFNRMIFIYIWF